MIRHERFERFLRFGAGVRRDHIADPRFQKAPDGLVKLSGDDLIALFYELKEAYLNNATWACSRSTLREIRTMKDGLGNYLWAPGIRDNARPATILDRPYITCADLPSVAANQYPVLFGDFRRAYLIVDRIELEVLVDPYTSKKTGMTEFSARKRVGGQVVLADALKKLKVKA